MNNYHVYILSDPRTNLPFYVGMGTGMRWLDYSHSPNKTILSMIKELKALGLEPSSKVYTCETEAEAEQAERELIARYGRRKDGGLLMNLAKGGRQKGEGNSRNKLTRQDVEAIRQSQGTREQLAKLYDVTTGTISDIRLKKTWKD